MTAPEASLLETVISPDRVFTTTATSKEALINDLIDRLNTCGDVSDLEGLRTAILARESLMSTGIGLGVGAPHARISSVRDMILAVAVNSIPLEDYESIDGQPVKIVFLVAGRPDQQSRYVRLLAALSHVVKDEEKRSALMAATRPDEILTLLQPAG